MNRVTNKERDAIMDLEAQKNADINIKLDGYLLREDFIDMHYKIVKIIKGCSEDAEDTKLIYLLCEYMRMEEDYYNPYKAYLNGRKAGREKKDMLLSYNKYISLLNNRVIHSHVRIMRNKTYNRLNELLSERYGLLNEYMQAYRTIQESFRNNLYDYYKLGYNYFSDINSAPNDAPNDAANNK